MLNANQMIAIAFGIVIVVLLATIAIQNNLIQSAIDLLVQQTAQGNFESIKQEIQNIEWDLENGRY